MGRYELYRRCYLFTLTLGIDNVKSLIALRIYASKWHVYSGLALLNTQAKEQIKQYSRSASELFKLMIQEREAEFRDRITTAFSFVFGRAGDTPILLADDTMDRFSLSAIPKDLQKENSHLSLLAIVDAWYDEFCPSHIGICVR